MNCLITETHLENEKSFLTCLYQPASQNHLGFQNFCTKLDTLMAHINNELSTCSVFNGDFNAVCSKWCNHDITNANGRAPDTLTSAGYK